MIRKPIFVVVCCALAAFFIFAVFPLDQAQKEEFLALKPTSVAYVGLISGLIFGIFVPIVALAAKSDLIAKGGIVHESFFFMLVGGCIGVATAMFFWMDVALIATLAFATNCILVLFGFYVFTMAFITDGESSSPQ